MPPDDRRAKAPVPPALRERALLIGRSDATTTAFLQSVAASVVVCTLSAVDEAQLARISPDFVIFPLLADDADALHVLARLVACGYTGRALITASGLPNGRMVRRELQSAARGIEVHLIEAGSF